MKKILLLLLVVATGAGAQEVRRGDGTPLTLEAFYAELGAARVIYLGEHHDRPPDHRAQLAIVRELCRRGLRPALGWEMFQRPFQPALEDYAAGRADEAQLRERSQWDKRWRFDWEMYAPLLRLGLPLVALNVPAEVSHKVFVSGLDSLSPDERSWIASDIRLEPASYRQRLEEVYRQHGGNPSEPEFENFFAAQVTWDETMGSGVVDYLRQHEGPMVVLVGAGHVEFGHGIPSRVERRLPGVAQVRVLLNPVAVSPGETDLVWNLAAGVVPLTGCSLLPGVDSYMVSPKEKPQEVPVNASLSLRLSQSQPLVRPSRPSPAPVLPDQVTLSGEGGGWRKLAAGALALGSLVAAAAPAMAQEVTQATNSPVDRHQQPISASQRQAIQGLSQAHEGDNAAATDVRTGYARQAGTALTAADSFSSNATKLENIGKSLELQADQLGPGHHAVFFGSIDVESTPAGETVTHTYLNSTAQVRHYGDSFIVEVHDNGGHSLELEDAPGFRAVHEGQITSTLYLTDSLLHQAGDFQVQNATRSYQENTLVQGTRLVHTLERAVPHHLESDTWQQTKSDALSYRHDDRQGGTREVDILPDGSTHSRTGSEADVVEPGLKTVGATISLPAGFSLD